MSGKILPPGHSLADPGFNSKTHRTAMPSKTSKPVLTTSPAILPIEAATKNYAETRSKLSARVADFQEQLARLRELFLPGIKLWSGKAREAKAQLEALITANRPLFDEPRTAIFHGIKVGLKKGTGKIEFDDVDKVVERIRAQYGPAKQGLLLEVKTVPRKEALLTLPADELKKLGCTITGTGDAIVIKSVDGEIEKLVAKILEEETKQES